MTFRWNHVGFILITLGVLNWMGQTFSSLYSDTVPNILGPGIFVVSGVVLLMNDNPVWSRHDRKRR